MSFHVDTGDHCHIVSFLILLLTCIRIGTSTSLSMNNIVFFIHFQVMIKYPFAIRPLKRCIDLGTEERGENGNIKRNQSARSLRKVPFSFQSRRHMQIVTSAAHQEHLQERMATWWTYIGKWLLTWCKTSGLGGKSKIKSSILKKSHSMMMFNMLIQRQLNYSIGSG